MAQVTGDRFVRMRTDQDGQAPARPPGEIDEEAVALGGRQEFAEDQAATGQCLHGLLG
jgi:hypothetical protein